MPVHAQVNGYTNARFKGFSTFGEAEQFLHAGGGPVQALRSTNGVHKKQLKRRQQGAAVWAGFMETAPFATAAAEQCTAPLAGAQQPGLPTLVDPSESYRLVLLCPPPALAPMFD